MCKHVVSLLLLTILLLATTAEAQNSSTVPDPISQGRQIHLRILDAHPKIDGFYRKRPCGVA